MDLRRIVCLCAASICAGALDYTPWFGVYVALTVAASVAVGFGVVRPTWLGVLVVAVGSPICGIVLDTTRLGDLVGRLASSFVLILPGLAVGFAAATASRKLRQPSNTA